MSIKGSALNYSKEDVEALLAIALAAREHQKPACHHPAEWRTAGTCGICLRIVSKREAGIYNKFYIERTDGSSACGGKHENCFNFVLDCTHDPHALKALQTYAESCRIDYPFLARDLDCIVDECQLRQQANELGKSDG